MTRYPTVLFDLDGTLIDSIRLILESYHHTLRELGFPPRSDEHWLAGVGTPLRAQFADWSHDADLLEAMVATYRDYNLAHHDRMVTVYPGVGDMLRRLSDARLKLALVTSKNRQGALRGLQLTGLADYFEVLVCVDDVQHPKPHPEPVERALALLGAERREAVFIGDSIHDMHAGRAAGVATAAALWGPFGREHLEPTAPDHWLTTPHEVVELVGVGGVGGEGATGEGEGEWAGEG
jgi:pyrophosphatase PpaX